jgi:hypothetical protein
MDLIHNLFTQIISTHRTQNCTVAGMFSLIVSRGIVVEPQQDMSMWAAMMLKFYSQEVIDDLVFSERVVTVLAV